MSANQQAPQQVPVLIVGGAVTGLSTAVFLGWHGIPSLVVERHPDTLSPPALARRQPADRRALPAGRAGGAHLVRGQSRHRLQQAADDPGRDPRRARDVQRPHRPARPHRRRQPLRVWAPIDQDRLEHLLRGRAAELGAELAFGAELVSFEESGEGEDGGVTAVLRDTASGEERTVRAAYLVAADGSRSPVRRELGIETDGPGEFATTLSVLFEADLSRAARGRDVGVCYLDKPAPSTILFAHDGKQRWIFATAMPEGETLETVTEEQAVELVRAAIGQPDLDVRIVPQLPAGGAKWLSFIIGAQVAREYRRGRVFLVGDAAHLVPPTGGFGASLGIQDAGNLAWKLAAVLDGESGPELLDTYQTERHPVAWMTLQQALGMNAGAHRPGRRRRRGGPGPRRGVQHHRLRLPVRGRPAGAAARAARRAGHPRPAHRAGPGRGGHLHPGPLRAGAGAADRAGRPGVGGGGRGRVRGHRRADRRPPGGRSGSHPDRGGRPGRGRAARHRGRRRRPRPPGRVRRLALRGRRHRPGGGPADGGTGAVPAPLTRPRGGGTRTGPGGRRAARARSRAPTAARARENGGTARTRPLRRGPPRRRAPPIRVCAVRISTSHSDVQAFSHPGGPHDQHAESSEQRPGSRPGAAAQAAFLDRGARQHGRAGRRAVRILLGAGPAVRGPRQLRRRARLPHPAPEPVRHPGRGHRRPPRRPDRAGAAGRARGGSVWYYGGREDEGRAKGGTFVHAAAVERAGFGCDDDDDGYGTGGGYGG
ncbi:FAD-dependent monooxygenase [Streptomyces sp. GKU 257-1]|nr:FAD-dependent monooxygenase [Streptomyces sp. GKU 257-1]